MASQPQTQTAVAKSDDKTEKELIYKPLGEDREISLTVNMTKRFLTRPTRNGTVASNEDVIKFMMLCQARQLNPWVGDAYLVGYDGERGAEFSLITAVQALEKRAEMHPHYDGMEHGILIARDDGSIEHRAGTFWMPNELLVGGWAKVYRKDRSRPEYVSLQLAAFNKGRSLWKSDPAGMINKCARAAALRHSFPSQTGGLYLEEEVRGQVDTIDVQSSLPQTGAPVSQLNGLTERMLGAPSEPAKPHIAPPREALAPPKAPAPTPSPAVDEVEDRPQTKRGRGRPPKAAPPPVDATPEPAPAPAQQPAPAPEPATPEPEPVPQAPAPAQEQPPWQGDQEPVDAMDVQDWSTLVDAFKAPFVPGNPDVDVLAGFIDSAREVLMDTNESDKASKIVVLRGKFQVDLETAWGNYALGELTKRALSSAF